MTVKELIDKLSEYPENMDIFLDERVTEFTYGLANSVRIKEVNFCEEPGGEVMSRDKVVIISEE